MSATFDTPEALLGAAGTDLGASEWIVVDQARINGFAVATGDQQWIHTDPERAAVGPFGGTIAHGYLSLSLLAPLMFDLLRVGGTELTVNAGSERVRFLTPVRAGARVRAKARLAAADRVTTGVRARIAVTLEIEHVEKPALVAEILTVFVPA